jgi:hypothetical protein
MTYCAKRNCKFQPWRGRLCYTHWRISQGFFFDPERKSFIKPIHTRTGTNLAKGSQDQAARDQNRKSAAHLALPLFFDISDPVASLGDKQIPAPRRSLASREIGKSGCPEFGATAP